MPTVYVHVLLHNFKVLGVYTGLEQAMKDAEVCACAGLDWIRDRDEFGGVSSVGTPAIETGGRDIYTIHETAFVE